jgi:hypothetical protein
MVEEIVLATTDTVVDCCSLVEA